jgi:hypothetical protein
MRSDCPKMLVAAFLVGSMACLDSQGMCANDPIRSKLSPDRQWHAVLFYRSCGAVSTMQVGVSVLPVGQDLPRGDEGNVLHYVNTVREPQVLERNATLPLPELEWKSGTQLNVRYDRRVANLVRPV